MSIAIIPSTTPSNGRWIQQVVQRMADQQRLVLHDHSSGLYLSGGDYDSLKVAEVDFKPLAQLANDVPNNSPIHVVAHVINRANFLAAFFKSPAAGEEFDSRPRIVFHVGRPESVAVDSLVSSDIVWISMKSREAYKKVADWLPQFLDLSFEDAVKIANATDRAALDPNFQRKYAQLLDITHPGDPTASLAFGLLCEAWLMNNGKPTTCEGIPSTPPGSLDDWLAPFKVGNITPDKVAVAAMMGKTLEAQATAVLDAVGQGDTLSISTAATAFVTVCSQLMSTTGGAV